MSGRIVNSLLSKYISKYISNQMQGYNQQIRKKTYFRASTNKEELNETLRSEIKYSAKSLITLIIHGQIMDVARRRKNRARI